MNVSELATEVWGYSEWKGAPLERLERFAALIAAHEREACAKVCEEYALESMEALNRTGHDFEDGQVNGGYGCAVAIRERGEK